MPIHPIPLRDSFFHLLVRITILQPTFQLFALVPVRTGYVVNGLLLCHTLHPTIRVRPLYILFSSAGIVHRPVRNKVCCSLHNYSCSPIIQPNLCGPSTPPQRTVGILCTSISVSPVPVSLPLGTIPALWYSANSYQTLNYSSKAAQFSYSLVVSPFDYKILL